MTRKAANQYGLQQKNGLTSDLDAQTAPGGETSADLNRVTSRVKLTTWPYTSPEVAPDVHVQAT
jgi:hypothetical protein